MKPRCFLRYQNAFFITLIVTVLNGISPFAAATAPPSTIKHAKHHSALLTGIAWYPEQWSEAQWEKDLQLMKEAGVGMVRIGEYAWSTMEPQEGKFNFEWMAQRFGKKPNVIGWQIGNEFTDDSLDRHSHKLFHKWLCNKYKTLDQPAVIRRHIGKGRITYVGGLLNEKLMLTAAQAWVKEAGIEPALGKVPEGVEVSHRSGPEHSVFVLINHSRKPVFFDPPRPMHNVFSQNALIREMKLPDEGVVVLTEIKTKSQKGQGNDNT